MAQCVTFKTKQPWKFSISALLGLAHTQKHQRQNYNQGDSAKESRAQTISGGLISS